MKFHLHTITQLPNSRQLGLGGTRTFLAWAGAPYTPTKTLKLITRIGIILPGEKPPPLINMSEKGILDSDGTTGQPRSRRSIAKVLISSAFILIILGSLVHPRSRCYHPLAHGYSRLRPMSIEGRVDAILSETPLIGLWQSNTNYRPTIRSD